MLKKAKILLASCVLLAGVTNVHAAGFDSFNVQTLIADLAGGPGTIHPSESGVWNNGGITQGSNVPAGIEIYADVGAAATSVNIGLSTDQVATAGAWDVELAVWGTNNSLLEIAAGTATWTQAQFGSARRVISPLDGDDTVRSYNFGGVKAFTNIGVASNSTMTATISHGFNWGSGGFPGSNMIVEFDTITVPAPAAALLIVPGLIGFIATGRRKSLKAA